MISFIGIFVFLVVIGANFWLGLWNNILTLVNFFIAAMVASAYYENMANLLKLLKPLISYLFYFTALDEKISKCIQNTFIEARSEDFSGI